MTKDEIAAATPKLIKYLAKNPYSTAGAIWRAFVKKESGCHTTFKATKKLLPNEDQSIREVMFELQRNGVVGSRVKFRSILLEWYLLDA